MRNQLLFYSWKWSHKFGQFPQAVQQIYNLQKYIFTPKYRVFVITFMSKKFWQCRNSTFRTIQQDLYKPIRLKLNIYILWPQKIWATPKQLIKNAEKYAINSFSKAEDDPTKLDNFHKPFSYHKISRLWLFVTVVPVGFSPDGRQVISGSWDHTICLLDMQSGQCIGFNGHTNSIRSVMFLADGTKIISGSKNRTLHLWDVASGWPIEFTFRGHTERVISFATSHDRQKIMSASLDDTIQVWDTHTGLSIRWPLKGDIMEVIPLPSRALYTRPHVCTECPWSPHGLHKDSMRTPRGL